MPWNVLPDKNVLINLGAMGCDYQFAFERARDWGQPYVCD